jgi:hypothetical protein
MTSLGVQGARLDCYIGGIMTNAVTLLFCGLLAVQPSLVLVDDHGDVPFPEFQRPAPGTITDAVSVTLNDLEADMQDQVRWLAPLIVDGRLPTDPFPPPEPFWVLWRLPRSGSVVMIGSNAGQDKRMLFVLARHSAEGSSKAGKIHVTGFSVDLMYDRPSLLSVEEGDCDGDGNPDALIHSANDASGLASQFSSNWILLLRPGSRAQSPQASLLSLPFAILDLYPLDVDGNGRLEFLIRGFVRCERCTDGRPHNFWVWDLIGIQDGQLVNLNATVSDFPRFEWLSFDAKDRWRPLLSPEMKCDLYGSGFGYPPYRRRVAQKPSAR